MNAIIRQIKKNSAMALALLMGASVIGGASLCTIDAEAKNITKAAAKQSAYADAGVKAADVVRVKAKLDTNDGQQVYEVEFDTATTEYNYDISATDGRIIEKESEQITQPVVKKKAKAKANKSYISVDQAKQAALNHAKASAKQVTFNKAKLDKDDGKATYDIEFYDTMNEYEYEIDAYTGKVLDYDKAQLESGDDDDDDD